AGAQLTAPGLSSAARRGVFGVAQPWPSLARRVAFQPLGYTAQLPQPMHVQALDELPDLLPGQVDRRVDGQVSAPPSHHQSGSAVYLRGGQAVEYLSLELVTLTLAAHQSTSAAEAGLWHAIGLLVLLPSAKRLSRRATARGNASEER